MEKSKPNVIVDVGVHIGVFSVKVARKFKHAKIYSIEPEKNNFQKLIINKKLNKLKNILPYKLGFLIEEVICS